jgi:hypothetical protein
MDGVEPFVPEMAHRFFRPSGWFETCSWKPIPKGLPSSSMQLYNTDSLHKFGLNLSPEEREQLIAFLKTL